MDAKLLPETAFEWMLGNWTFERSVAPHASMRGSATVTLIAHEEALYSESAQVMLTTGEVLSGAQTYRYQKQKSGFDILFAETEALFQSLRFQRRGGGLTATATHRCLQDDYSSEYVLRPPNRMYVRHRVHGPMKHYVSVTAFLRVS